MNPPTYLVGIFSKPNQMFGPVHFRPMPGLANRQRNVGLEEVGVMNLHEEIPREWPIDEYLERKCAGFSTKNIG
jgi:hypothetical protein